MLPYSFQLIDDQVLESAENFVLLLSINEVNEKKLFRSHMHVHDANYGKAAARSKGGEVRSDFCQETVRFNRKIQEARPSCQIKCQCPLGFGLAHN